MRVLHPIVYKTVGFLFSGPHMHFLCTVFYKETMAYVNKITKSIDHIDLE